MTCGDVLKLTAFTSHPTGGNPAGVWIGDKLPTPEVMQRIAADVGFSETAFIAPAVGSNRTVCYFSPAMEVPFCGHATIASGVALATAEGPGTFLLDTPAGQVSVSVFERDGALEASLTSVEPRYEAASEGLVSAAVETLGWSPDDLDPSIPPAMAFAGAWHLVLAVRARERLDALDYDFDRLKALMERVGLVTLQLVWRESGDVFHSRNPFPVGGVVEDPATGAAAAALGGYLRESKQIDVPATFHVRQGEAMGRPSLLRVDVPEEGGIVVSGTAVAL